MDLLNSPFSNRTLLLSRFSFNNVKLRSKHVHVRVRVRVSAHFGRPTSRRNSLRKKLIEPQQVRENGPVSINPKPPELEKLNQFNDNLSKLEAWRAKFDKDIGFWGIGSIPIFTVFHDSEGNVKRVLVNEDEILNRIRVREENSTAVESRITYAKSLAREMERGVNVIERNSSVAKFVALDDEKGGFVSMIREVVNRPNFIPVVSEVGKLVLCVSVAVWAVSKLFAFRRREEKITELEKEMMRRKIKARKEKEVLEKGKVEVVSETIDLPVVSMERPKIAKGELMKSIEEAKVAAKDKLVMMDASSTQDKAAADLDNEIEKIRATARQAQGSECESSIVNNDNEEKQTVHKDLSSEMQLVNKQIGEGLSLAEEHKEEILNSSNGVQDRNSRGTADLGVERMKEAPLEPEIDNTRCFEKVSIKERDVSHAYGSSNDQVWEDKQDSFGTEINHSSDTPGEESCLSIKKPSKRKPRLILSVRDAKEFLAKKGNKQMQESKVSMTNENSFLLRPNTEGISAGETSQRAVGSGELLEPCNFARKSDSLPVTGSQENSTPRDKKVAAAEDIDTKNSREGIGLDGVETVEAFVNHDVNKEVSPVKISQKADESRELLEPCDFAGKLDSLPVRISHKISTPGDKEVVPEQDMYTKNSGEGFGLDGVETLETFVNHDVIQNNMDSSITVKTEKWMEKNFHVMEPIVKKIGEGFQDNYKLARERVSDQQVTLSDIKQLYRDADESEFEWMKDESLKQIVFRVRDNELSGRDPFYLMDDEDKGKFFRGLEKKVELENEKLALVHEYLHSNIENLDYGADGISLYDPPEKFIPCWKGSPPEFLNSPEQKNVIFSGDNVTKGSKEKSLQKPKESTFSKNVAPSSANHALRKNLQSKDSKLKDAKTIIEGSDGSIKVGKKSGKEYWQHTKKWSRGFLESYNAETDPEVKSIMKDIGKDLDRWITEEEIKEAADLMNKLPERNKKFMEQKINKLKREMELFGPQAVVSKYREYAEEKEEDYLWWLDLPHILCIEIYTIENKEQRIGLYSLEMAADLELEPKPCHVVAFEDAGDCKNLCYIIQAHMEMIGNGHAFVVARPPKDAFREAKANGFGLTVIRKGELQLNVDQTLEEVEEQIVEIGSKIYHDELMKERSVDISSLMKGVFGFNGQPSNSKRKKLKRMKKPNKR